MDEQDLILSLSFLQGDIMSDQRPKKSPYFYLALCILLWASIPVATKKILIELDNIQTLFYSTIFSTAVMGILVLVENKSKLLKGYGHKKILFMAVLGFLGNYFYYILLYAAFERTTAAEAFILEYTWPLMVLLLSFFILKEKVTVLKLIGIAISFFGIVVITTQGQLTSVSFTNLYGNLLAICSAVVFALFSVLGKKSDFDHTVSVFIYFLAALIYSIPTVFFFSSFKLPSIRTWLWIIYNGVFVNGISYVFWFKALKGGKTHLISNLLYLTPFVSLIYIALLFSKNPIDVSLTGNNH